jgi:hypothetical protein
MLLVWHRTGVRPETMGGGGQSCGRGRLAETVPGACGRDGGGGRVPRCRDAAMWAWPLLNFPLKIQNQLKLVNYKIHSSLTPKIFKLCMGLYLNIMNNFLHLVNFKFSTEFKL